MRSVRSSLNITAVVCSLLAVVSLTACGGGGTTNPPAGDGGDGDWLAGERSYEGSYMQATLLFEGQTYEWYFPGPDACPPPPDRHCQSICEVQSGRLDGVSAGTGIRRDGSWEGAHVGLATEFGEPYRGPGSYPVNVEVQDSQRGLDFQSPGDALVQGLVIDEELTGQRLRFHFNFSGLCPSSPPAGSNHCTAVLQGEGICLSGRR